MSKRITVSLLAGTLCLLQAVGAQAQAVLDNLVEEPEVNRPVQRATDRPAVGVAPLVGRLSFNGTNLEFTDRWIADLTLGSGSRSNTVGGREINFVFGRSADQRVVGHATGATFESQQSAWIAQLRATDRVTRTTTTRQVGGDLTGFRLQFSATGRCFLPGAPVDGFCTYTPGMSTVDGAVDPDTLAPNLFAISSEFGEEISQDVHESLKAEGWQRGEDVPGAGLVGVDFDVANAGFVRGDEPSMARGDRRTDVERRLVLSFGKIDQTIASSSREAAATRSTRSFVLLDRDEWTPEAIAMQLLAPFLPAAPSGVAQASGMPNLSISNNLFFALNNARVPAESFTVFQTGRAELTHGSGPARSAAETPTANYLGVWMGFSPVRERTFALREQFIPTGDRISISDPIFAQGGGGTPFRDLIEADFFLFDEIDQSIRGVNFQNIDDLFVQMGLDVTTQEAVRRLTATDTSTFRYVPHIAFDGNVTGGESVFRYYAGAIFGDETNAYLGADYLLQTETGWNAFARVDLYSAPDQDYFSEVEASLSRTLTLGSGRQFTLGAGFISALDGLNRSRASNAALFSNDSRQNFDVVMRLRDGPVDYTLRQRFSKTAAEDDQRSTTLGVSYAQDDSFFVSAQVTPVSTETTWLQGAATLNWRLGDDPRNQQLLQMQVTRVKYDLGNLSPGSNLSVTENTFGLSLQARF